MGNFQNAVDAKRRLKSAKNENDRAQAEADLETAKNGLEGVELQIVESGATKPAVEAVEVPGGKWQIATTYVCPHCGVIVRLVGGALPSSRCPMCWLTVGAPT